MKYLLYALGEIVLVVIGILIAVRIDNWNETRKKEEAFHEIMEAIAKDIKADIVEYDFLLRKRYRNDSLLREVINGKIKEENYRKNWKELKSLITASTAFHVHQNGFLALQKILDDVPKEFGPTIEDLTNYYMYEAEEANYVLQREDRLVWNTIEDWQNKYTWHSISLLDTGINSEKLNYFLKSPEYKNKAATFLINTKNVIDICESGRTNGMDLLLKLREFKSSESDTTFLK